MMSRTLEIAVISAEGLRENRKPISSRRSAFAVVKIDPFNVRTTNPDEYGGSHPTWNDKFEMEMPMNGKAQFVSIEILYRTDFGSEKKVGCARIPTTDFMGGFSPEGHLNFLSYRLRDECGRKSGIINVSIRVKPDARFPVQNKEKTKADYGACSSQAGELWRPATSIGTRVTMHGGGNGGQIVTGVPIWCHKTNSWSNSEGRDIEQVLTSNPSRDF